jgi:hypothetical protein
MFIHLNNAVGIWRLSAQRIRSLNSAFVPLFTLSAIVSDCIDGTFPELLTSFYRSTRLSSSFKAAFGILIPVVRAKSNQRPDLNSGKRKETAQWSATNGNVWPLASLVGESWRFGNARRKTPRACSNSFDNAWEMQCGTEKFVEDRNPDRLSLEDC